MAYGLFLDEQYDEGGLQLLVVSSSLEKITSVRDELANKYTTTHKLFSESQQLRAAKFSEFQVINKEFWDRNKLAIKNPSHPHGLWVIQEFIYSFRPSGMFNHFFPDSYYQDVRPLTEQEIEIIRNRYAQTLSGITDYSKCYYIDWDKITEPIPVFYMEGYDTNIPKIEGYHPDYLVIKEIEEV